RSAEPVGRGVSVVARAARAHHRALRGADPAAARSGPFAHSPGLCATLRAALGRPVARGRLPRRGRVMPLDGRWLRQAIAFAILLAVWELAGQQGMLNPMYAPSPSRVGAALAGLFADGRIWPHLEATFVAALGGLAIGIAVGIVLGVAAALVRIIAELL